jgi:hypothetical protein
VLAGLLLTSATVAFAQNELTDAQKFRKRVSRLAPLPDATVRGLCVCQDGSSDHGRAGELRQEAEINQVRVTCSVPSFAGEDLIAHEPCGTFVPLAR